jgi:transcriptional regulator with XRE-family HTH domain
VVPTPARPYGERVPAAPARPNVKVGHLVREWRVRRRRSQMDLALDVGVSPRHLSFVETGRSKPSPELVLTLADHLDVPLRERNVFMLAAGYAPRFTQTPIDDDVMSRAREVLQRLLDGHHPYPGVVIDRSWNVVMANPAAERLMDTLPEHLTTPVVNVFRACLHPDGLAGRTLNLPEWGAYLLQQLRRLMLLTNDPRVVELYEEVRGYSTVVELEARGERDDSGEPAVLIPWSVQIGGRRLSFFTTLTSFGTPRDITLDEVAVELFYPADDPTAQLLEASGRSA